MKPSTTSLSRRALFQSTLSTAVTAAAVSLEQRLAAADNASGLKGRIHHSVCKWCYPKISLEDLCSNGKNFGLSSIDLLNSDDFPTLKKHGLSCAMASVRPIKGPDGRELGGITRAFNRKEHHDLLIQSYEPQIQSVADAGFKNLICFSGNRDGLDDETGLKNCAEGLKRLMALCEKRGVTLVMELLNSKVNHPDYMCDKSAWGIELCNRVGSQNFKLLYDIYHMQIMEGDVIATIRKHHAYFAHYHTGGVPGRHEIDDSQELNYPAIMRAIADTGFQGHVAQEFIPARPEPIESLRQAVRICDI
jgi:hydroxypyruvate isomerase